MKESFCKVPKAQKDLLSIFISPSSYPSPPKTLTQTHTQRETDQNVSPQPSSITVPQALLSLSHTVPPWLDPSLPPLQALLALPPLRLRLRPARLAPADPRDEVAAGARGVLRQRQDRGGGGGPPGAPPQVQAAREEEEEVPGPRPRQPVRGRRLRAAREVPSHQQDQDLPRRPHPRQSQRQAQRRRRTTAEGARDSLGVSAALTTAAEEREIE